MKKFQVYSKMVVLLVDFDLKKHTEKKSKFSDIMFDLVFYAGSISIGFLWSSLFMETVKTFLPEGQGLWAKYVIYGVVTFVLVMFFYTMARIKKDVDDYVDKIRKGVDEYNRYI